MRRRNAIASKLELRSSRAGHELHWHAACLLGGRSASRALTMQTIEEESMNPFKLLPCFAPLALAISSLTVTNRAEAVSWKTCVVDDFRVYADHKVVYRCEGSGVNYYLWEAEYVTACADRGLALSAENYRGAISILQSSMLTGKNVSIAFENQSQCYSVNSTVSIALL